jgi:glutamyl-tRNA(Gln) amidotransferase subunit E
MYPETDVRPMIISNDMLAAIQAKLPEMPEEKVARFVSKYGVHEQQARQLVKEGHEDLFEELAGLGMAAVAARTFLNTYAELENEGINIGKLEESRVKEAFLALKEDAFAKEALPSILKKLLEGRQIRQAIDELGLKKVDSSEAQSVIASIVLEKEAFVREKGLGAIGPLMAPVMERLRGKLDGKIANQLLKQEIEKLLAKQ